MTEKTPGKIKPVVGIIPATGFSTLGGGIWNQWITSGWQ